MCVSKPWSKISAQHVCVHRYTVYIYTGRQIDRRAFRHFLFQGFIKSSRVLKVFTKKERKKSQGLFCQLEMNTAIILRKNPLECGIQREKEYWHVNRATNQQLLSIGKMDGKFCILLCYFFRKKLLSFINRMTIPRIAKIRLN